MENNLGDKDVQLNDLDEVNEERGSGRLMHSRMQLPAPHQAFSM